MAYRDLPPTNCRDCQQAEMTPVERLVEKIRLFTVGESISTLFAPMENMGRIMAGRPPVLWYDRHRAEFEKSGSMTEFARMLRHTVDLEKVHA